MGSLTQLATIRLGKRTDNRTPYVRDFVPLAGLTTWCSAAGTSIRTTPIEAAMKAAVLEHALARAGRRTAVGD